MSEGPAGASALQARVEDALKVHIDARVIGYHLTGDPRYGQLTAVLFDGLRSGRVQGQTSAVTLYQLLAEVFRRAEAERAGEIAKALTVHRGLELVPVTERIATQAAQVRAQLGGRSERALQIATALVEGADLFLTEGSGLRRIVGMSVENLDTYL